MTAENASLLGLVDLRCKTGSCAYRDGVYRMIGRCANCGADPLLFLVTTGHEVPRGPMLGARCPICDTRNAYATRLANPDEIPSAVGASNGRTGDPAPSE